MTFLSKEFDEYWERTAGTRKKLVPPRKPARVLEYVAKRANDIIPESADLVGERACILASDMELPFEWAEAIVKLRSIKRPKNIPLASWLEIQRVCTQLYCDDFRLLKLIIKHEWSLEDIYGCHPNAPLLRFDVMGLLLLLDQGQEIIEVDKERIKIRYRSGSVNCFSRRLDKTLKGSYLWVS